jgi:hypothetical protein
MAIYAAEIMHTAVLAVAKSLGMATTCTLIILLITSTKPHKMSSTIFKSLQALQYGYIHVF